MSKEARVDGEVVIKEDVEQRTEHSVRHRPLDQGRRRGRAHQRRRQGRLDRQDPHRCLSGSEFSRTRLTAPWQECTSAVGSRPA